MLKMRREMLEHGHERFVIYFDNGRGGIFDRYEVGMERNKGGTWIHRLHDDCGGANSDILKRPLGFLYPNTDYLIAEALSIFVKERIAHKAEKQRLIDERRRTCQATTHYGCAVDLSSAAAYAVLSDVQSRKCDEDNGWFNVEILYQGKWLLLARTDLMDDVGTLTRSKPSTTPEEFIAFMREKIWFGARVSDRFFSVVDSLSDG
jgi:hypothetical protein